METLKKPRFRNKYFGMRHGQSKANELGIILTDPQDGKLAEFGLTELGRRQALFSAVRFDEFVPHTIIFSSNFSRAKETAEIAAKIIGVGCLWITWRLRERYFGKFERMGKENYQKVWNEDALDPNYSGHGGESVNDVLKRMLVTVESMEKIYFGKNILLVSHGDPLQILECYFKGISPSRHREMKNLENAEIRRLS